jgi:Bacterial archaeo-eukaryotic release factor family 2
MVAQAERSNAMMLSFLRPLYHDFGGWVSVYVDTSRRSPAIAEAAKLRWREARDQLASQGADATTLDALQAALDGPELAAPGRAMFARDGRVLLTPALRTPPELPRAEFGPLPDVLPFLVQHLPAVPRVQVSVGRDGGAIVGVDATAASVPAEQSALVGAAEHAGGIEPVHKAHVGGLGRPRRETGIERNWDDNAKDLAARVQQTASKIGAAYLLLAGDVKARGLLLRHLRPPLSDNVVVVDAEIAADSAELAAAADVTVAQRLARQDSSRFGEWHRLHAHGLGAEGLPAVIAALRDGLAAEVFLSRQPRRDVEVWTGPAPTDIATARADLQDRGIPEPVQAAADSAVIRAVAGTDAELRFLPAGTAQPMPADHICATLR